MSPEIKEEDILLPNLTLPEMWNKWHPSEFLTPSLLHPHTLFMGLCGFPVASQLAYVYVSTFAS